MDDPTEDDLGIEINPRPASEVATRLLLLVATANRAALEAGPDPAHLQEREADRFDLIHWLTAERLLDGASSIERVILIAPLGGIDSDQLATASWAGEGAVVLAWALGMTGKIPTYGPSSNVRIAFPGLPEPWGETDSFLQTARLRDEEQLAHERERAEIWHWRAETEALRRTDHSDETDRETLVAVADVAVEAHQAGLLSAVVDGDFPVDGQPYRTLSEATAETLAAIAFERLRGLNWTCGFGNSWEDVPTDV